MTRATADCPSKRALDQLRLGELDAAETAALRGHVDQCEACRQWLAGTQQREEQLLADVVPSRFARGVAERLAKPKSAGAGQTKTALSWLFARPLPVAAAAIGVLIVAVLVLPHDAGKDLGPRNDGIRTKGNPAMTIFRKRSDRVTEHQPGERVRQGDAIRFQVFPGDFSYLLILSGRADGNVSVYVPFAQKQSLAVTPNQRVMVPGSIVIDDDDDELLVVILTPAPLASETTMLRLQQSIKARRGELDTVDALDLPGRAMFQVLRKEKASAR